MIRLRHLFLDLPKTSFKDGTLSKIFKERLKFPRRQFPPHFMIKDKNFFCGGYFVSYSNKLSSQEIAEICKAGNWQSLAESVGDFLIIYCDFVSNELFILTDQTGTFPCYFSAIDDKLIISTDSVEVKKALSHYQLNVSAAFDYLARSVWVSDTTLISEITQIPPATLLKINSDFSYSLTPLLDLNKFLVRLHEPYVSTEKFVDDFVELLKNLVVARLASIDNLPFAADISSGFDATLICYLLKKLSKKPFTCYSLVSQYTSEDTNPQIVTEFAQKHDLIVKFIDKNHLYPFSSNVDLNWIARGPTQAYKEEFYYFLSNIAHDGNKIRFTGDGGDEIYWSYRLDSIASFPIQQEYFHAVRKLKSGIDQVLTKDGIEILLDRQRFQKKKPYPLIVSPSVASSNLENFPICWETEVWPITPFADPRLVQLARRAPSQYLKISPKQEIWKYRKDIFLESQFKPKGGPYKQAQLFLEKKPNFVISVLQNSLLAQKGWVKASKIVEDVQEGNIQKYFEGDVLSFLINVLQLEYFLQQNNVKVPDY